MKTQFARFSVAAFCAALSAASFGQAINLAPGGVLSLPVTPTLTEASFENQLDFSTAQYIVDPFVGLNAQSQTVFTGTMYEGIYHDTATGGMDFFFQIANDGTSPDAIADVTFTHFAGFSTSVLQFQDNGSADAGLVSRDSTGDIIDFSFLNFGGGYNPIAPGTNSSTLGILTNATSTTVGSAQIQDGGNVVVSIVGPAAVPEPAPMSVLALGGLVFLKRRKKA